jgi:hypothetical protein
MKRGKETQQLSTKETYNTHGFKEWGSFRIK